MKPMLFRFQTIMHNSTLIEARVQHNLMGKVEHFIFKIHYIKVKNHSVTLIRFCNYTDLSINIYKALQSSTAEAKASS